MFVCALLFALASEDSSEHRFRLAVAAFGLSFSDRRQQFELDISAGGRHVVGAQVCRLSSLVYALMSIVFFSFL